MKAQDIKIGVTYRGKSGPDRTVTEINDGEIVYAQVGCKPFRRKFCWCSTFAAWVREIVDEQSATAAEPSCE